MFREIIIDTETTGLDPYSGHRLVEIAAVEMENKILTGNKFHTYINPRRNVPEEAFRVHGISEEFLKDKPFFEEIAEGFLDFVQDSCLVIHNASFDLKFLNYELSLLKKPSLERNKTIDTLALARKAFPGKRANLDALCERFNIDNSGRKLHGALKDANLLAHVYVELMGGRQSKFSFGAKEKISEIEKERSVSDYSKRPLVLRPTEEEEALRLAFLKDFLKFS